MLSLQFTPPSKIHHSYSFISLYYIPFHAQCIYIYLEEFCSSENLKKELMIATLETKQIVKIRAMINFKENTV